MVEYWGSETRKAIANFPVSGERVPASVIRWLGRIKSAAAVANAELGILDGDIAGRMAAAADEIGAGQHADQFPIDVFQTGSGTSTNMNVNEVIAHLAGADVHPNDHVNLGQSSNDVFPTAVHLATLEAATTSLVPSLRTLHDALDDKSTEFADIVKAGRTHLMDAVPITLGQEFGAFAHQMSLAIDRVEDSLPRLAAVPLGGTAVGTGLNTHIDFAQRVRELIAQRTGIESCAPDDRFEAQASRDALVEFSGVLKVIAVSLTKIANDIALLASGPRAGFGEITLPELQKGSSIMPGKVNPVLAEVVLQVAAQVIGNDTTITIAGMQGNFQLNVRVPLIARNILSSVDTLSAATGLFAERCVIGIVANEERLAWLADNTLASATALNPIVGYDVASQIVRRAERDHTSLRDAAREFDVDDELIDDVLDPRRIASGNLDVGQPPVTQSTAPTRAGDVLHPETDRNSMETLSQAITRLKAAGYDEDYTPREGRLVCGRCGTSHDPAEMTIDEIVRFEGNSDPGDEAIAYALAAGCNHRGVYVAAYGPAATADDIAVVAALPDRTQP